MTSNYNSGFVTSMIKSRAMLGGCVCSPNVTPGPPEPFDYEWSEHPAVQYVMIDGYDISGIASFNSVSASFNGPSSIVSIGNSAIEGNTGSNINAIGKFAASYNTGSNVNAIGDTAASNNHGNYVNAIGSNTADNNSGNYVNAIGSKSAIDNTGSYVNAIGYNAGYSNTGNDVVAIGANAAFNNSGNNVIAIGNQAAYNINAVDAPFLPLLNINAIGRETCLSAECRGAVDAIGYRVGLSSTIYDSVLIGKDTGRNGNYLYSVVVGCNAGHNSSLPDSVVIGCNAASNSFASGSVVIGEDACPATKITSSICIGPMASASGVSIVSIGDRSFGGGCNIVSIGEQAGRTGLSGFNKIHIGTGAGGSSFLFSPVTQNRNVIAIGDLVSSVDSCNSRTGYHNTGSYTTAIGGGAGCCNSGNNCIFLGTNPTFDKSPYVNPETTTADNRFLVYSTHQFRPFLYGDLSMNKLCIGNSNLVTNANLNVSGSAYFTGQLYDSTYSAGSAGQILTTTGTSTAWTDSATSIFASFLSMTTQNSVVSPASVPITYSERTVGTIDVFGGTYPNSQIVIPVAGTYKVVFSAQCDSVTGNHPLEIFPVIGGVSVPKSNTRIRLAGNVETCLTVEYILDFTANQILQFYMTGTNTDARILAITRGGGTPVIPDIPSMIVTVIRIA